MSYRTLLERINSGASVVCIDVRDTGVDNEEGEVRKKIENLGKGASKLEWLAEKLQKEYEKRNKNMEKEDIKKVRGENKQNNQ